MKYLKGTFGLLISIVILGTGMDAFGFLGFGGTSWKEEVLLHDGQKVIVARSVDRGGRHEIGQQPPIKEQSLTFTLPTTSERIIWRSDYSQDVGLADFMPILLDIVEGTAYVVTTPVGCLSYNKWGRPNPPYVVFKYDGKEWQRITLLDLPVEIKAPNLIISSPDNEVDRIGKSFLVADEVKKINSSLTQPEYKTILREPLAKEYITQMCEERVYYKGAWIGPGDSIGRRMMDQKSK